MGENEDLPEILADPDRLEQVFINLVMNAKDAIEAKREVRKTVMRQGPDCYPYFYGKWQGGRQGE